MYQQLNMLHQIMEHTTKDTVPVEIIVKIEQLLQQPDYDSDGECNTCDVEDCGIEDIREWVELQCSYCDETNVICDACDTGQICCSNCGTDYVFKRSAENWLKIEFKETGASEWQNTSDNQSSNESNNESSNESDN